MLTDWSESPEASHSWIYPLYQGFRTCLKTSMGTLIESENDQQLARNQHKLAGEHSIWHVQLSQAWGRNESGEEETDRCRRQAIIKSKCNRCWQGSDPGSEMTGRSPPDVSERGEISQQEGTKANWRHVRRKDEKRFFTTAIITHDHYSAGSVEHHLQPHQPESPAWWLRFPNGYSVMSEVGGRPGFLHLESSRVCSYTDIDTDYAKYYIAGHWKTGPKALPAWGPPPPHTHTGETLGRGAGVPRRPAPGPDAYMNVSKHLLSD